MTVEATARHSPAESPVRRHGRFHPLWSIQVFLRSCTVAFAHERMMHTWWTWAGLWMVRLVAEISFFALIGRLIGSDDAVAFLLIGAAMLSPAYGTMFVAQAVRGMMFDGLIPYLIAAPAPSFPAALGRSVHWCVDGVIAGTLGLLIGNAAFDLGLSAGQLAALIGLVMLCPVVMIGTGLMLGSVATRIPTASNLLSGLARGILGLLCGATFAVTFLPGWLQVISKMIPLTHLVAAARDVTAGDPVGWNLLLAAATGLAWVVLAYIVIKTQFERARRTGVFE
ncbi:MAG: ABC transporter permease [Ilumatobacteraceae bacterium]